MSDVVNEETGNEPGGSGAAQGEAVNHDVGRAAAAKDAVNDEDVDVGAIAAEFVLGTLDSAERARANALLEGDPHFRGMIRVWERRLGELHLMVEPVDPPPPLWEAIKGKLDGVEQIPIAGLSEEEPPVISADKTRATLEALEAQLREEGLAPAPATEPDLPELIATRALERDLDSAPPAAEFEAAIARSLEPYPHRPVRSWGFVATLMTLIAIVLAGLIGAWRYFPDRLPLQLRAEQVLNIRIPTPPPAPAPARPTAPPESQFDE